MKVAIRRRVQAHGLNLEKGSTVDVSDALAAELVREGAAVAVDWPGEMPGVKRRKRVVVEPAEGAEHGGK